MPTQNARQFVTLLLIGIIALTLIFNISIPSAAQQLPLSIIGDGGGGTSSVSLGTFTQNWQITYSNGEQFNTGPTQPQQLSFLLQLTGEPVYDPTKFWTVDVQVPVTYTGGLIANCPFNWNSVLVTGTATVGISNLETTVNGQVQNHGNLNLGSLSSLGLSWDPCTTNPPVAGQTTKEMEFWITNAKAYNQLAPAAQPFAFNLEAALNQANVGWLSSFTLSVSLSQTVTNYFTQCTGSPSQTGICNNQQLSANTGTPQTFFVAWSPPAGLTTQATTTQTVVTPPYSLGCQGVTCSFVGTNTQTQPATGGCITYSGTTYCYSQSSTSLTNSQHIIFTQSQPPTLAIPGWCDLLFGNTTLGTFCKQGIGGLIQGWCSSSPTMSWLCATWFLWANWIWILILLLLVLAYLLLRRRS